MSQSPVPSIASITYSNRNNIMMSSNSNSKSNSGHDNNGCTKCGEPNAPRKFSRCNNVLYCNPDCQRADWKHHERNGCLTTVSTTTTNGWQYWIDTYTNEHGEDLSDCLSKYGVGGYETIIPRIVGEIEAKVLFLNASKSTSDSWTLSTRNAETNEQYAEGNYEGID